MTNNPTIDGVSRCKACRGSGWIDNLRSVGATAAKCPDCAPAVEQQEPPAELFEIGEIINRIVMALPVKSSTTHFAPSRKYTLEDAKSHARLAFDRIVELADQKSTIARLEVQLNNAINLHFQRRERITQLESEKEFAAATYQAARDRIAELTHISEDFLKLADTPSDLPFGFGADLLKRTRACLDATAALNKSP